MDYLLYCKFGAVDALWNRPYVGLTTVLPTVMIDALAIHGTSTSDIMREALMYANIIGCDLGQKLTLIGSLATLLWLHVLRKKGIAIKWGRYFRTGVVLTLPTSFVTLTGLYLWLSLIG